MLNCEGFGRPNVQISYENSVESTFSVILSPVGRANELAPSGHVAVEWESLPTRRGALPVEWDFAVPRIATFAHALTRPALKFLLGYGPLLGHVGMGEGQILSTT